jgi:hypothetical protein
MTVCAVNYIINMDIAYALSVLLCAHLGVCWPMRCQITRAADTSVVSLLVTVDALIMTGSNA